MKKKPPFLWIINFFIILTVIVLAGVAYLTVVRATITVSAGKEKFTSDETFNVNHDGSSDSIYGDVMTRDYESTGSFDVGKKTTVSTKAGGTVTIVNNYNKDQALVKTTRLLSKDNKLFRLTEAVYAPAGKSVDAFVEADQTGDGNLIGPTTFTIPGLWEGIQDKIFATSETAMTYNRIASAVITADDIKNAEKALTQQILTQAAQDFGTSVPKNFTVTKDQLTAKTVSLEPTPAVGKEATKMTVHLKTTVAGMIFNPADVRSAAEKKLKTELPDPDSFIELVPDSLVYSLSAVNVETKSAQLKTQLVAWIKSTDAYADIDKKNLTGKSVSSAEDYLHTHNLPDATVKIWPGFVPWMPLLSDHIMVEAK